MTGQLHKKSMKGTKVILGIKEIINHVVQLSSFIF